MSQNKKEYRVFCRQHQEMPLFMQDWWLDIVCNKKWEVALYKNNGGHIVGVLPYFLNSYWGLKVILMAPLTPYTGVWIDYPVGIDKLESKYRLEKKVVTELIHQLPKVSYYAQRHPISFQNHLPFIWQNFQQTSYYTFVLRKESFPNCYANFRSNVRNRISKAEKIVKVTETNNFDLFYHLNQQSFQRQGLKIPYTQDFFQKIDEALKSRGRRKIYLATDENSDPHAAIYLVWDDRTMYNLTSGANTKLRTSGAVQLLFWKAIQLATDKNLNFDFEGGMMPNIENIFRAFGGEMIAYHKIYKSGNRLIRFLETIK